MLLPTFSCFEHERDPRAGQLLFTPKKVLMKQKLFYALVFIFLFSLSAFSQINTPLSSRGKTGTNEGIDPEWYSKAQQKLTALQYSFRDEGKEFTALNPENNTLFVINAQGYTQRSFGKEERSLEAGLTLVAIDGEPVPSSYTASRDKAGLSFLYDGLTVEYRNDPNGLRQNFIVQKRNVRQGNLSITLAFETSLALSLNSDRKGVTLSAKNGQPGFYYDGLVVWDAKGKALDSWMEIGDKNHVTIHVADADAVYPITIDPLNHTPNWTDSGGGLLFPLLNDLSAHVLFGYSISSAGDVNGDGYGDIIVGAPAYVDIISISGGTYNVAAVGAAFIYYGSPSGPSADPSEVLQPTTVAGALFGYSVSKAGDINGDGYGDVVVGAPGDRTMLNIGLVFPVATSVATGKVYVYYGGPAGSFDGNSNTEPTVSAQLSLTQPDFGSLAVVPINPLYGFSVGEAGDVNGDGRGDIVVGSPAFTRLLPLPVQGGRVDVYHGTTSGISASPSRTITGGLLNALFGFSVSTAGNVNGDAYSDIIAGAPGSLNFLGAGQAYVFHGSSTGVTATTTASANAALNSAGLLTTLFGYNVSNAGDVNGDGFGDVIVGEPAALESLLTQTASVGAARIFYGSASGATTTGATTLNSPRRPSLLGLLQGNLLFGYSVSGTGDVNCDGFADIIIGEPGGTALSLGRGLLNLVSANVVSGRSYVYFGRAAKPVNSPSYTIEQTGSVTVANLIGYSVADGGDVNGDGRADLLVGAPNGTLDLSGGIIPAVGSALGVVTTNSVGSSYLYAGCLSQTILPLTLLSFDAEKKDARVQLNWSVREEVNFDRYELERSADGRNFSTIAVVLRVDPGTTPAYHYNDALPLKSNYYRLKMIDLDGTWTYSPVAFVRFDDRSTSSISIAPNPVSDRFTVSVAGLEKGIYELRLVNARGQVEARKDLRIDTGIFHYSLERDGRAAGVYFIGLYSSDGKLAAQSRVLFQ